MASWICGSVLLLLTITSVIKNGHGRAFDYDDQDQEGSTRYLGRVQMKVFRGPTAQSGEWAPHGYWVRQPSDTGRHNGQ